MNTKLAKKVLKSMKRSGGFTLLEILVVLTIMGFLIAMVAPRLAGISGGAVDTVCDTNQNRMVGYLGTYFEKTNKFPDKLTNIVDQKDANASYQIPAVSDDDIDNGPETLASELYERNHFAIHYLNADEVKELRDMGIITVLNLNAYDALNEDGSAVKADYVQSGDVDYEVVTEKQPFMNKVRLAEGTAVAMIGCGSADNATAPAATTGLTERGWGEADSIGRIIMGMGPGCGLITSGIIANAAHCPGGLQNADNVTYNDYNIILPRLSATADRMQDTNGVAAITNITDNDANTDGVQVNCLAYDDSLPDSYVVADNDDKLRARTFTLTDAQEGWQYATQCPEGHMYPEDDGEFWAMDLNNDGSIGD